MEDKKVNGECPFECGFKDGGEPPCNITICDAKMVYCMCSQCSNAPDYCHREGLKDKE
jgi:hypothetical protein